MGEVPPANLMGAPHRGNMKTTSIRVNGETWDVPRGFGLEYKRELVDPASADVLRDLLELIGYTADLQVIESWPLRKRIEIAVYARNVHFRASDNPIQRYPKPDWLREDPWQGVYENPGSIWRGLGPTRLCA